MRDQQQGEPQPLAQPGEQGEDLAAHRHVERGDRLVGHQQLGLRRQRPRDAHPLPLAARQLVREAPAQLGSQPHHRQQLPGPPPPSGAIETGVDRQRLGHDRLHPLPRVERAVGVLEDHLEAAAAGAQGRGGQGEQILAVENDPAGRGLDQPQGTAAERRLAAPRLPHQGQAFAAGQVQIDAVEGPHGAPPALEQAAPHRILLAELRNLQESAHGVASRRGRAASSSRV